MNSNRSSWNRVAARASFPCFGTSLLLRAAYISLVIMPVLALSCLYWFPAGFSIENQPFHSIFVSWFQLPYASCIVALCASGRLIQRVHPLQVGHLNHKIRLQREAWPALLVCCGLLSSDGITSTVFILIQNTWRSIVVRLKLLVTQSSPTFRRVDHCVIDGRHGWWWVRSQQGRGLRMRNSSC